MNAQNKEVSGKVLLMNTDDVRIDAMNAVNDLYNFDFDKAEKQFRWLKQQYPEHPLSYFLMGLSQWWRMLPDFENIKNDENLVSYMDTCIELCEKMFKKNENDIEATFFSAAAYGFKGRLYGDREKWRKATYNGMKALKYIKEGEELGEFSYEFKFGSGLYYYYSVWIPENFWWVKPLIVFKTEGDKNKGIELLKFVSLNAFYTRTEAQYFLMRIYANEEDKPSLALPFSKFLYETFPKNSYFQRYYMRLCFQTGDMQKTEMIANEILNQLEMKTFGFCNTDGRYASFYMAYYSDYYKQDREKARQYYEKNIFYSLADKSYDSWYYHKSLCRLAFFSAQKGDIKKAKQLYRTVTKHAEKKKDVYKEAKEFLKKN